jgi:hypothetical protein
MSKRTILIGALVLVVLGLLAGGAYTVVQLLVPEAENGGEETAVADSGGGGRVMQSVMSQNGGPPVAVPPISPIIAMAFVCGSFSNASRQSMKLVPLMGSPPIPTHVL